jgi:hypothetical protein
MDMEHELIKIGDAAKILSVSTKTLRRWHKQGFLPPTFRSNKTTGGTRFYSVQVLMRLTKNYGLTIAPSRKPKPVKTTVKPKQIDYLKLLGIGLD